MSTRLVAAAGPLALLALPAVLAGPLDPPLPPGSTQAVVEPRTPISESTTPGDANSVFRITQPGSYYLTSDVNGASGEHGIEIETSGVTIDLNGFSLAGVPGSLDGINMADQNPNLRGVTVQNGHIRDWGGSGIELRADSSRIEGINTSSCGDWGIDAGTLAGQSSVLVLECTAHTNGISPATNTGGIRTGDVSSVLDCTSAFNTGTGILVSVRCVVSRCTVSNNTDGISMGSFALVTECTVDNSIETGILASIGSSVTRNTICNCDVGIDTGSGGLVLDNNLSGNDVTGILVNSDFARIEGNQVAGSTLGNTAVGIQTTAGTDNNVIVGNTCISNTSGNYDLSSGTNAFGPISTLVDGAITATNPFTNFSF